MLVDVNCTYSRDMELLKMMRVVPRPCAQLLASPLLGIARARGSSASMHRNVAVYAKDHGTRPKDPANSEQGRAYSAPAPITEIKDVQYRLADHIDSYNSVAIAVDDTIDAQQAVEWAIENLASDKDGHLRLLHVLCDDRCESTQTGSGLGGPRYRVDSMGAEELRSEPHKAYQRKLVWQGEEVILKRALGAVRKAQLHYSVHTPVLNTPKSAATIAEEVCADAARTAAKMLVVAVHGPGAMAQYGSVARYCCQHSQVPLVLLPSQVMERSSRAQHNTLVALVHDHSELKALLDFAARNIVREGDEVVVAAVSDSAGRTTIVDVPEQLRHELRRYGAQDVRLCELPTDAIHVDRTGEVLCQLMQDMPVRSVLMMNYSGQGMISEALHGSLSSYISCNAHKPLVLLPAP